MREAGLYCCRVLTRIGTVLPYVAMIIAFLAFPVTAATQQATLTIEHATLQAYPEADCTKLHVYVKNTGPNPVMLKGIYLGDRYLDLVLLQDMSEESLPPGLGLNVPHIKNSRPKRKVRGRPDGRFIQWFRALPNAVEHGRISDVTISLKGVVEQARVRIVTGDETTLTWKGPARQPPLRLSHIAFDPGGERIYLYVENKTGRAIRIDHAIVNDRRFLEFDSIPSGEVIESGRKSCLILRPEVWPGWGTYAGVGVKGTDSDKAFAVVRVMDFFPVGAWDVDTRSELFFDTMDLRIKLAEWKKMQANVRGTSSYLSDGCEACQRAYFIFNDPTCCGSSWEDNIATMVKWASQRLREDPYTPWYTHICKQMPRAYALFGELPDVVFVNPYLIRHRKGNVAENGKRLRAVRQCSDPRPVAAVPEAFVPKRQQRELSPEEVVYAMWTQIAAGAKGVRYYQRTGTETSGARGYEAMPRVEDAIRRENLQLQILKPFLRISDTMDLASASRQGATCHSLLCGDKGVIVVVLNDRFHRNRDSPTWWRVQRRVDVALRIPSGRRVRNVYRVDHGLSAVPFQSEGRSIRLSVDRLHLLSVYLVSFRTTESGSGSPAMARSAFQGTSSETVAAARDLNSIVELRESFRSARLRLARRLLRGDRLSSTESVLSIGLRLGQLRDETVAGLARMLRPTATVWSGDGLPETLAPVFEELAEGHDVAGLLNEVAAGWPATQRNVTIRQAAVALARRGHYTTALDILEALAKENTPLRERIEALNELVRIYSLDLGEYDEAIVFAARRLKGCPPGSKARVGARYSLGLLFLSANMPKRAATCLADVASQGDTGLNVYYPLGLAQLRDYDYKSACRSFAMAAHCDPDNAVVARYFLARALLAEHRYAEAREALEQVLNQSDDPRAREWARRLAGKLPSN